MRVWAIVLAGGSGSRFGGEVPKQYLPLAGRRVIDWSIAAAFGVCDGVVLVAGAAYTGGAEPRVHAVVEGGSTRSASVRNGLAAVPSDAEVIVVHDGARPLASSDLFLAVIEAVRPDQPATPDALVADAAIPVLPVTDTIKRVDGRRVVETVDRAPLVAVQTPQAFLAGPLRRAHAAGLEGTDDASLIEQLGGTVVVVPGEPHNLKITTAGDLVIAALYAH